MPVPPSGRPVAGEIASVISLTATEDKTRGFLQEVSILLPQTIVLNRRGKIICNIPASVPYEKPEALYRTGNEYR